MPLLQTALTDYFAAYNAGIRIGSGWNRVILESDVQKRFPNGRIFIGFVPKPELGVTNTDAKEDQTRARSYPL